MTKEELYSMKTEAPDRDVEVLAKQRWDSLVKPIDGLGAFEEMICRIAGIQGKTSPTLSRKGLIIMCADNGVVEEGVTQTGQSVTYDVAEMMGERRRMALAMATRCFCPPESRRPRSPTWVL